MPEYDDPKLGMYIVIMCLAAVAVIACVAMFFVVPKTDKLLYVALGIVSYLNVAIFSHIIKKRKKELDERK